jgi:alkylation response protein AidB-like acyl-CoA dehydrogenase
LLVQASATVADRIVESVGSLCAGWDRANDHEGYPAERLAALHEAGALAAFVVLEEAGAVDRLRLVLRLIGGADLSLGRIVEGHVNAAQLVHAYGGAVQRRALATDLAAGRVFGVWNTEPAPGVTIAAAPGGWRLRGAKSFATGAGHLDGALITARREDGAKQMVLVPLANEQARADRSGWRVRGMRGTGSGRFDFSGLVVGDEALIGGPDDYEREPRFSAGAWRFTAVQLGAVAALLRHWRDALRAAGKDADPIQRAGFARAVAAARSADQWVARAAHLAEAADPAAIPHVLMTRGIVEEAGLLVMEGAARAIGTASFFEESRIDRITRDLGLYLRQPAPDQARDSAAAAWLDGDCWGDDPWW